jgi:hypothetical protein
MTIHIHPDFQVRKLAIGREHFAIHAMPLLAGDDDADTPLFEQISSQEAPRTGRLSVNGFLK